MFTPRGARRSQIPTAKASGWENCGTVRCATAISCRITTVNPKSASSGGVKGLWSPGPKRTRQVDDVIRAAQYP